VKYHEKVELARMISDGISVEDAAKALGVAVASAKRTLASQEATAEKAAKPRKKRPWESLRPQFLQAVRNRYAAGVPVGAISAVDGLNVSAVEEICEGVEIHGRGFMGDYIKNQKAADEYDRRHPDNRFIKSAIAKKEFEKKGRSKT
jgi:transposase